MASSSYCDHNKRYLYDVFLSFSGEDTRKTFVDHLYDALDRHGICTFKDDVRLEKGKNIRDDLLESIEESRLCIIVFSKKYASSSWCLNELLKIMECHKMNNEQKVFPVFYDVDPSEVRHQNGLVGEALKMLKNKNKSDVEKWREALTEAANLSGWDLKNTFDGHEAKVVKLIVERVSLTLPLSDSTDDENLVGMEERMQDVLSCLNMGSNDVHMIGIKGMGGAGKTTLALAIFEKISSDFDGSSFVENVREKASQSGVEELQNQVISDLLNDSKIIGKGVHAGKKLLRNKLRCKKVLVVLDDVYCKEQLEELAGDPNWFGPGSRIIITTRDEEALNTGKVNSIIDVELLSDGEAIRLFSRHAFMRNFPTQEYEEESGNVVRYAAGLPLTIKVLGSTLRGKDKPVWIDLLARLKTIPLQETLKKLELSYESLEDDCKELFLHVACFLRNWQKDDARIMLESCGFHAIYGLKVLEQKSLIKIIGGVIRMHDHIVEMGENIEQRQHPRSRMWVQDEIERVLANGLDVEAIRCMNLTITRVIDVKRLKNMKNLSCLIVNNLYINRTWTHIDEVYKYFPDSLRYLRWYGYRYSCLDDSFDANNLFRLDMSDSIQQLWEPKVEKVMKNLKFLVLVNTNLKSLDLELTPKLERLDLQSCHDLVKLNVHGGCLKTLVYLNLSRCWKLKSLDLGLMSKLKRLELESCSNLEEFNVHGGCLESLVYLNLSGCYMLKSLDLEMMPQLERLELESCSNLEEFNVHGGCLETLVYLKLSGCKKLKSLDLGLMYTLQKLDLQYCLDLVKINVPIGCLKSLVYLKLTGCMRLKSFLFIKQLESLEVLHFDLLKWKEFPEFILTNSNNSLLKLHLSGNYIIKALSVIENLHKLVSINLSFWSNLKSLPESICSLQHLRTLELEHSAIEELPDDLGKLQCLEELNLSHSRVKCLPNSICMLKHLNTLCLKSCEFLEKLPEDVGLLASLKLLNLSYCSNLKDIPSSICKLKHLNTLCLKSCEFLEKLPEDVGLLASLKLLNLSYCRNLKDIPSSICKLKHLRELDLSGCWRLGNLPDDLKDLKCVKQFPGMSKQKFLEAMEKG